jgi:hypothetical protein
MVQNWALREVQLAFDKVDYVFLFPLWKPINDNRSMSNILEQG